MADLNESLVNRILLEKNYNFVVRREQLEIINSIHSGKDTFAVLPTGFGKTICYVLPTLIKDKVNPNEKHTSLVISPLKALIRDQVQALREHNIRACGIHEGVDKADVDEIKNGNISVLLASPEAIITKHWLRVLQDVYKNQIVLVAYDEAHCISEWGLDFRDDYRKVGILQSILDVPVLTLSATCTNAIKADIEKTLGMTNVNTFSFLPNRANIFIDVHKSSEKYEEELSWLMKSVKEKGASMNKTLLYVNSIGKCEEFYIWMHSSLREKAYDNGHIAIENRMVEMFHAHTDTNSKERILNTFCCKGGRIRLLICTVAVGMGIDIPDVSIVVIWGLPSSLLQLWQEAGRAGRDGRSSISLCYAYPRSIALPCDSCRKSSKRRCECASREYLKALVSTSECKRVHILSTFSLSTENKNELKEFKHSVSCNTCENNCTCKLCKCCISCQIKCTCPGRLKSLDEILLSYM